MSRTRRFMMKQRYVKNNQKKLLPALFSQGQAKAHLLFCRFDHEITDFS